MCVNTDFSNTNTFIFQFSWELSYNLILNINLEFLGGNNSTYLIVEDTDKMLVTVMFFYIISYVMITT